MFNMDLINPFLKVHWRSILPTEWKLTSRSIRTLCFAADEQGDGRAEGCGLHAGQHNAGTDIKQTAQVKLF